MAHSERLCPPWDSRHIAGLEPVDTYTSLFPLGQRVFIGDDDQTVATVTGLMWKSDGQQVEVTWMNAGTLQCAWVSPMILRPSSR